MHDTAAGASIAFKAGLEVAARAGIATADPGAVVTYDWGIPDVWTDDCVLFQRSTSRQVERRRLDGRDSVLTCDVLVLARRTDQRAADLRAADLLAFIEHHVAHVDPTLGGAVLWCSVTSHQSTGITPGPDMPDGRGTEITATFTAQARISTR